MQISFQPGSSSTIIETEHVILTGFQRNQDQTVGITEANVHIVGVNLGDKGKNLTELERDWTVVYLHE